MGALDAARNRADFGSPRKCMKINEKIGRVSVRQLNFRQNWHLSAFCRRVFFLNGKTFCSFNERRIDSLRYHLLAMNGLMES